MKVILVGAAGRMGRIMAQTLVEEGEEIAATVDVLPAACGCPHHRTLDDVSESADVILDFSHRSIAVKLVELALARRLPLVVATTGHTEDEVALIKDAARDIPVFLCGNMSFGVALFASLAGKVAAAFPYADVEIVETHHAMKSDVPSGTALMLAKEIDSARGGGSKVVVGRREGKRTPREISISSLRIGDRAGVHEVLFDTGYQLITLRHEAFDRKLFAVGALNAVRFLKGKPAGLYSVADLISAKGRGF